ncbi:trehalose-6-phosphate synthase [Streptomyces regensis]|uniref:Membrane protein n=2 Tax=Prauserella rugosa TaxID=43354 RepID=A0A660CFP9_9PSEU|nr:inner membrane protein YhjD [Prauserella sp. Am3]KMS83966.1 trehalose-6-phosphate synthase [Streptomyces regensis]TWH22330.1 membrane protein [Prauserella rugosa]
MTEQKADDEGFLPRMRRRYPWLDHVVRANDAFSERHGNHYAAAITYFSVLSLFPLLMVAFSVAGFVLAGNATLMNELREGIVTSAPEGLQGLLEQILNAVTESRAGLGVIGLLMALYSGLGWMGNLRDALTAQWAQQPAKTPFLSTKIKDLLALAGLGAALVVSFGLTAVGGQAGAWLLGLVGLEGYVWAQYVLRAATIVLSLAANVLVFTWVISQLPRDKVNPRSAVKGAVLAAIGFELLKNVGSYYLASVTSSPSGALFGPIIGLLVFANLVSRFLLFITAWTATARENQVRVVEPPPPTVVRPNVTVRKGAGMGAAAGAFGIGALLGWLGRRRS